MTVKHELRRLLWKVGYDVGRFTPASHPIARRKRLLATYGIDTVLDVGANAGQFATELRKDMGYGGRILSFEPLGAAFESLRTAAADDPLWEVFNFGLGDTDEKREINVSDNSYSSSLLEMLPSHLAAAPNSRYIGKESVVLKRLDSMFTSLCGDSGHLYLKIDTQGFEDRVLQGAETSLAQIHTVQMELSLVPLYEGQALFTDLCVLMRDKGYSLVALENGFSDGATGELLQADGIFHRGRTLPTH